MVDRVVDGLDDVGHLAGTGVVEHPQVDQVCARRHAGRAGLPLPVELRAGDDAGHVRAVPVSVEPAAAIAVAREVHAHDHLVRQRAVRRDARVHDGDADAGAVHGAQRRHQARPRRIGARGGRGQCHVPGHHGVGRHRLHVGVGCQRVEHARRNLEHRAAAQPPLQLQRMTAEHLANRLVAAVDDHLDGAAVALANLVLQVARQPRATPGAGVGEAWQCHQESNQGYGEAGAHLGGSLSSVRRLSAASVKS